MRMGQAGWRGATSVKHRRLGVPFGPHGRWCTWVAAKRAVIAEQARTRRYLTQAARGNTPRKGYPPRTQTPPSRSVCDAHLINNFGQTAQRAGQPADRDLPQLINASHRFTSLRNAIQRNASQK